MSHYQQSDLLSTVTTVPLSGTGTSTPEAAAANAGYSAWRWEVVLATVLGTPIPDRSEVIGQPWLTIVDNGQAPPGSHLIWSAKWDDKPSSGAASIGVYLNPQLYTAGGAWDQFENAPTPPLAAAAAGDYRTLTIDPPTFQSARVALAAVISELSDLGQEFSQLDQEADSAGFRGSMAGVAADLFNALRAISLSLNDQMTSPVSYSNVMGTTGDAAGAFLTSLITAYTDWLQLSEHSPLGAVVQVLAAIGAPDGVGGYAIPDPQNTPYGDLTTNGPWAAVEQQAKNVWTGALIGDSDGFAGLDPLGQSALGKLVAQYNTAIGALVPVIGPAPPPIKPNPVGGSSSGSGGTGGGSAGNSGGPSVSGPTGGAGTGGGPGPGGGPAPVNGTVSHAAVVPPGGPGGAGVTGGATVAGGGAAGSGGAAPLALPVGLAASGGSAAAGSSVSPADDAQGAASGGTEGTALPAGGQVSPGAEAAGSLPAQTAADAVPLPAGQVAVGQAGEDLSSQPPEAGAETDTAAVLPRGLAGAIGASEQAPQAVAAVPESLAFAGTIGQPDEAQGGFGRRQADGRETAQVLGLSTAAGIRHAPAAGFSIGRDLSGDALEQAAVPMIKDKPSAVLSSSINGQLGQEAGGNDGLAPAQLTAGSASPGSPAGLATPGNLGGSAAPGSPELLGPGAAMASGEGIGGNGQIMPGAGLGMGGMGGRGQPGQERERLAYLPEDEEYWETDPEVPSAAVGADARYEIQDQEFTDSSYLAGIGANYQQDAGRKSLPDRRTP